MKEEFDKEASVTIKPSIHRDINGQVLGTTLIARVNVVPKGKEFSLSVDVETVSKQDKIDKGLSL